MLLKKSLFFAFVVIATAAPAWAEETPTHEDVKADHQAIKEQRETMKSNAQAAMAEQKALHEQIAAAETAGDTAKAKELRQQLKSNHQANKATRKENREKMHGLKKDVHKDRAAIHAKMKEHRKTMKAKTSEQ